MPKKGHSKLNGQHRQFCDLYLESGNATTAYMTVYKVKREVAGTSGSRLLQNVRVRRYLTRARLRQSLDMKISRERIVGALAALAFADLRKLGKWNRKKGFVIKNSDDLDDASAYAVESIRSVTTVEQGKRKTETELRTGSKKGALDTLLKMHGWDVKQDSDLSAEERVALMKALMGQMDAQTSTGKKGGKK